MNDTKKNLCNPQPYVFPKKEQMWKFWMILFPAKYNTVVFKKKEVGKLIRLNSTTRMLTKRFVWCCIMVPKTCFGYYAPVRPLLLCSVLWMICVTKSRTQHMWMRWCDPVDDSDLLGRYLKEGKLALYFYLDDAFRI